MIFITLCVTFDKHGKKSFDYVNLYSLLDIKFILLQNVAELSIFSMSH